MQILFLLGAFILQNTLKPIAENRTLLLFGHKQEVLVKQQRQLLQKDSNGLKERDIDIKIVYPNDELYKKHTVAVHTPFTVILIGKDGGEKYRSNRLMTCTQLFTLIDAMPMRQAEMRKKKKIIE